jgi:glutamate formiminotransferase
LVEAAVALARAAMVEIDLTRHRGVHPRVGAVDVLPLVAVGSAPIELAIETARVAGRLLAAELELPVLLYGEAASRSKRRPLAAHRRGGLAALTVRMERGEWPPDFGPKRPHPTAGVVLVGARRPLVAFNVVLDSDDVLVAKSVAAALREGGSAGMLGLRALGLVLESRGKVQVSMNLTAPDKTPLASVVAAVEREAARWGVSVLESELVGLTPAAAVAGADAARLKLPGLEPRQIVESYLDGVVAG